MPDEEMILTIWEDVNDEFPDKSTELCLYLTAERAGCEYLDVINTLSKDHDRFIGEIQP